MRWKACCRNRSAAPLETARRYATPRAARLRPQSPRSRNWTFASSRLHRRIKAGRKATANHVLLCWGNALVFVKFSVAPQRCFRLVINIDHFSISVGDMVQRKTRRNGAIEVP
jgi:hypothetical protein